MKNLKKQVGELPCKDCITKAICRNELYEKLSKQIYIDRRSYNQILIKINIPYSIYYTLCEKCILVKMIWIEHRDVSILKDEVIKEFKISTKEIESRFISLHKEWIEKWVGKNYNVKYTYEYAEINRNKNEN